MTAHDPLTNAYYRDIKGRPVMTPEEEKTWGELLRGPRRQEAIGRFWEGHLRFVVFFAERLRGHGVPMADLVSEGNIGLYEGAVRYDPTRGKFLTYAMWWVRRRMLRLVQDNASVVRIPNNRYQKGYVGWLAHKSRYCYPEAEEGLFHWPHDAHVDGQPKENGSPREFPTPGPSVDDQSLDAVDAVLIRECIDELPDREAQVVRRYFGFGDDGECQTLTRIGEDLQICKERVRQIREEALDRIRKRLSARKTVSALLARANGKTPPGARTKQEETS